MKKKGFTLVELVVAMAILVIFMSLVLTLFISQSNHFNSIKNQKDVQNETRMVLVAIEDDFKVAKNREINIEYSPSKKILYKYEVKVSEDVTEYYGYVYDSFYRSVKKHRLSFDGTNYKIREELANLSENVETITIEQLTELPEGSTQTKDVEYKIDVKISRNDTKFEEKNEDTSIIITRN